MNKEIMIEAIYEEMANKELSFGCIILMDEEYYDYMPELVEYAVSMVYMHITDGKEEITDIYCSDKKHPVGNIVSIK
jgi:hypothetical protein